MSRNQSTSVNHWHFFFFLIVIIKDIPIYLTLSVEGVGVIQTCGLDIQGQAVRYSRGNLFFQVRSETDPRKPVGNRLVFGLLKSTDFSGRYRDGTVLPSQPYRSVCILTCSIFISLTSNHVSSSYYQSCEFIECYLFPESSETNFNNSRSYGKPSNTTFLSQHLTLVLI